MSSTTALESSVEARNRSLKRGLDVLEAICAVGDRGIRIADLMRACDLERATLYRILGTLIDSGFAVRRKRFWYFPGPKLSRLAPEQMFQALAAQIQPVLADITDLFGDASFAIVPQDGRSHCIARQIGTYPVQVLLVTVGRQQPLGIGAAGLAYLAALPEDDARAVVERNADELPQYGRMTPARLMLLIKATRERGWSVVGNHVAPNVLGVGMAIIDRNGLALGAVSLAASTERLPRQRQLLVINRMRVALRKAGFGATRSA